MGELKMASDSRGVHSTLKNIFMQRFNINIDNKEGWLLNKHLLGIDIGLEARDLVYLYFDIEREFGIAIPEEDIAGGKFNTFNDIAEIIYDQLQKKEKDAV